MQLDPIQRFQAIMAGPGFPAHLREEPILFESRDPLHGFTCSVEDCAAPANRAGRWCNSHGVERKLALKAGTSEPDWLAGTKPRPPRGLRSQASSLQPCQVCPDRDAMSKGLCRTHANLLMKARRAKGAVDEKVWLRRQTALPGNGPCQVGPCPGRAEGESSFCPRHHKRYNQACKDAPSTTAEEWSLLRDESFNNGHLALSGLAPMLAAQVRYGIYANGQRDRPARWHPSWLRALATACRTHGFASLQDIDTTNSTWTAQSQHINRIVRQMVHDCAPVQTTREESRELGYIDPAHWGFRFPQRRSPFDLHAIEQRWLRDLTWDWFADMFDSSRRPRSPGLFEAARRGVVVLSAFLREQTAEKGQRPDLLDRETARAYQADWNKRVQNGESVLGLRLANGETSKATELSRTLLCNAARRILAESSEASRTLKIGLRNEFVFGLPTFEMPAAPGPRPLPDEVYRKLLDPSNQALLDGLEAKDAGVGDVWRIQIRIGRRISEVVGLRLDCVAILGGQPRLWHDMSKINVVDYSIPIPQDTYDVILSRQAKTTESFRLKHGRLPSPDERRKLALFPSHNGNPELTRSFSTAHFQEVFGRWLALIKLPGYKSHQARHSLATRLLDAGASQAHIQQMLGQMSVRTQEAYARFSTAQLDPFLRQVWVGGPGAVDPGALLLQPEDLQPTAGQTRAHRSLIDLTALPTEHGLCTLNTVVGGADCPFGKKCDECSHFVLTGADYNYWKRQEARWTTLAEGAPTDEARDYLYARMQPSSRAIAGLEQALEALGLLDAAKELDLRTPTQDYFSSMWTHGWRAQDLRDIDAEAGIQQDSEGVDEEGDDWTEAAR